MLLTACLAGVFLAGCADQTSEPLLERALAKIREGKYDAAALYLEQALDLEPQNPDLMIQLGIAYMHMQRLDDAARTFIRAADEASADPRPLEFLAIIHKKQGKLDYARQALRQASALDPSARVITSLALVEISDENLELASQYLEEALKRDPNYPSAIFNLARLNHLKLHNPEVARSYYEQFLKIAPKHKRAQAVRGALRALDAAQTVESASDSGAPTTPVAAHVADSTTTPAAPTTSTSQENRRKLQTTIGLAHADVANGNLDVALERLKSAVRDYPLDPDAFWELVIMYDKHVGSVPRSIRGYSYFQEKFPDDNRALSARRRIQTLMAEMLPSDFEQQLHRTRRAQLQPDIERAGKAFIQGRLCQESEDFDGAAHYYKLAIAADPYHAQAFHYLGITARELGDLRSAGKALQEAVAIRPDSTESWYALARVLIAMNQHDAARSKLQKLLALQSGAAEAYYLLGVIEISAGEPVQARTAYQEYIALAPDGQFAQDATRWLTLQPN
ncbi:MAG: tetratricopeptide repeat protein [Verrucomicrobia bacterium]|nr:tetratricopeptide repeat protein [Verrucomicrobiota bacterium]